MSKKGLADNPLFIFQKSRHDIENEPQISSNHDSMVLSVMGLIHEIGTEAITHRFSKREKQKILELMYKFRNKGVKISENLFVRISINYMLQNHEKFENQSIFSEIIKKYIVT